MSSPDGPPDDIIEVVDRISEEIRKLTNTVWAKGMRDGMEMGALICGGFVERLTARHEIAFATVAASIGDTIRLAALQVETPK